MDELAGNSVVSPFIVTDAPSSPADTDTEWSVWVRFVELSGIYSSTSVSAVMGSFGGLMDISAVVEVSVSVVALDELFDCNTEANVIESRASTVRLPPIYQRVTVPGTRYTSVKRFRPSCSSCLSNKRFIGRYPPLCDRHLDKCHILYKLVRASYLPSCAF